MLDCHRGFDALVADIRAHEDMQVQEGADVTLIRVPSQHAVYAVAKRNNYAYPAIVFRQFDVGRHGTVGHGGCGFGDLTPFAKMLKDFEAQDIDEVRDGPAPGAQP